MADKELSSLTATTTLASGDLFFVDDGGNSRKIDWDDVVSAVQTALTIATTSAAGTVEFATVAEIRNDTADKAIGTDEAWDSLEDVTLTDAATIAVDMDTFINGVVTLGGNRTLGTPSNAKPGQSGHIRVVQDGTGSRTLSYAAEYEFAGGSAPTLTTTASAEDLLFYKVITSSRIFISPSLDIS